jgi:hypothetical protein
MMAKARTWQTWRERRKRVQNSKINKSKT